MTNRRFVHSTGNLGRACHLIQVNRNQIPSNHHLTIQGICGATNFPLSMELIPPTSGHVYQTPVKLGGESSDGTD